LHAGEKTGVTGAGKKGTIQQINVDFEATGVKIPAFILKITIELYRHSGMSLAGMTCTKFCVYLAIFTIFIQIV
jgi:hypothetical protein